MKLRSLAIVSLGFPLAAFAAEPGGAPEKPAVHFYVGAGAGWSDIKVPSKGDPLGNFSANALGFRAIAGVRYRGWLGLEGAYTDYGSPSGIRGGTQRVSTEAKTTSLAALVFLPLSASPMDIYGKFGFYANNDGKLKYTGSDVYMKLSGTGHTFGVGAQYNFKSWSLRGEFEHLDTSYQDANLLSVTFVKTLY